MAAAPAIEAIGVSRSFGGVRALDDAAFSADFGEVHALVGENGAGKSTLMKLIYGVYRPDAGELRVSGTPTVLGSPAAEKYVAFCKRKGLHPVSTAIASSRVSIATCSIR